MNPRLAGMKIRLSILYHHFIFSLALTISPSFEFAILDQGFKTCCSYYTVISIISLFGIKRNIKS